MDHFKMLDKVHNELNKAADRLSNELQQKPLDLKSIRNMLADGKIVISKNIKVLDDISKNGVPEDVKDHIVEVSGLLDKVLNCYNLAEQMIKEEGI